MCLVLKRTVSLRRFFWVPTTYVLVDISGLQIRVCNPKLIFLASTKTYIVDTQKNRLTETILMSTHIYNFMLKFFAYLELMEKKKNNSKLSVGLLNSLCGII